LAQDVFDVSGAGDTVMAVTAAATADGIDMETILELANTAAGIAVSKVGTYQVKRKEVLKAWQDGGTSTDEDRIFSWEEAEKMVRLWQARGETVVFTNGCFDILHRGHLTYLAQAAELGAHLLIGLNSDASVKRLKGEERPVNGEKDRAFMLAALRMVDGVVLFCEDTPEELLSHLKPDILVKGGDYKPEEVAGREYAGRVEILPFVDGYSTTGLISKIRK
jgi:D-beta-D-heptose 7-phosphate kinase / D-beta-D-heptose 1-phosphate adenosyltransferase